MKNGEAGSAFIRPALDAPPFSVVQRQSGTLAYTWDSIAGNSQAPSARKPLFAFYSRIAGRESMLICRPFPFAPFRFHFMSVKTEADSSIK